ncbi:MAG: 5'-nucleotidase C-terminal domain-containing protein [Dysgonamonadaceae bacterium]|jgi:2',3'-cyclic-nucleotide 2'-phosphodiesterase (5'-nucleotidase family)|nr:5'-nucleotidase C-terminal domain-containing protein [Dysgonamonadaceae bacterium]
MKKRLIQSILPVLFFAGIQLSCTPKQYVVTNIQGTRILMDSAWEAKISPETKNLVEKYKSQLDDQMNEVIGEATETMRSATPQSLLTNLTSDVMKQSGEKYSGQPVDFAVCNVHGHRAILAQGSITVGNLFEIYSFDNLLVVLDLEGKYVKQLFKYYASNKGEGVSSDVQLKIKDKKIESLSIGGKPVNDNQTYRIATLDYLADGNSGMSALTKATKILDTGITLRDVMIDYVRKCTAEGKKINSKLDNRIIIEE